MLNSMNDHIRKDGDHIWKYVTILTSVGNYIATQKSLSNMLDVIILKQKAHIFATDELQFGFKPNHSTTQCTFALNGTILYK